MPRVAILEFDTQLISSDKPGMIPEVAPGARFGRGFAVSKGLGEAGTMGTYCAVSLIAVT